MDGLSQAREMARELAQVIGCDEEVIIDVLRAADTTEEAAAMLAEMMAGAELDPDAVMRRFEEHERGRGGNLNNKNDDSSSFASRLRSLDARTSSPSTPPSAPAPAPLRSTTPPPQRSVTPPPTPSSRSGSGGGGGGEDLPSYMKCIDAKEEEKEKEEQDFEKESFFEKMMRQMFLLPHAAHELMQTPPASLSACVSSGFEKSIFLRNKDEATMTYRCTIPLLQGEEELDKREGKEGRCAVYFECDLLAGGIFELVGIADHSWQPLTAGTATSATASSVHTRFIDSDTPALTSEVILGVKIEWDVASLVGSVSITSYLPNDGYSDVLDSCSTSFDLLSTRGTFIPFVISLRQGQSAMFNFGATPFRHSMPLAGVFKSFYNFFGNTSNSSRERLDPVIFFSKEESHHDLTFSDSTSIMTEHKENRVGVRVSRGTEDDSKQYYYCGRSMPDTGLVCGPTNGPQCADCSGLIDKPYFATVKRQGSVSSYPLATASVPSEYSVCSFALTECSSNYNWLSFGFCKKDLKRSNSDGVGMSPGTWGLMDDRGKTGDAAFFSANGIKLAEAPRKLRIDDVVTICCDLKKGEVLIYVNDKEFSFLFKASSAHEEGGGPLGVPSDFKFGTTLASDHAVKIVLSDQPQRLKWPAIKELEATACTRSTTIKVGDVVRIKQKTSEEVTAVQEDYGGVTPDMIRLSRENAVGVITRVTYRQYQVQCGEHNFSWNRGMIERDDSAEAAAIVKTKTSAYRVGRKVRIRDSPIEVAELAQEGCGGWVSTMAKCMGKIGEIERVATSRTVRVKIVHDATDTDSFTWNRDLVELLEEEEEIVAPKVASSVASSKHASTPDKQTTDVFSDLQKCLQVFDPTQAIWTSVTSALGLISVEKRSSLLHVAVRSRDFVAMQALLQLGIDVNLVNSKLESALSIACENGDVDTASMLLLERGANPRARNDKGEGLLFRAAKNGDLRMVKFFVEYEEQAAIRAHSLPPLSYRPVFSDGKAQEMLKHNIYRKAGVGYDVVCTITTDSRLLLLQDMGDWGKVHMAMMPLLRKKKEFVEFDCTAEGYIMLCKGGGGEKFWVQGEIDLNEQDSEGATPLFEAIRSKREEVARYLFSIAGVNKSAPNPAKFTLLNLAAKQGLLDVVRLIFASFPEDALKDLNTPNDAGVTPLINAASSNFVDIMQLLLNEKTLEIDYADLSGFTAIHNACKFGHVESVKLLLAHKAEYSIPLGCGTSPLKTASRKGHAAILHLLLDAGADIDARCDDGYTALQTATCEGNLATVTLLLSLPEKPNVELSRKGGWSPLNSAAAKNFAAICELLLDHGASHTVANDLGFTPLLSACAYLHERPLEILLDRGADPSVVSLVKGSGAIHLAVRRALQIEQPSASSLPPPPTAAPAPSGTRYVVTPKVTKGVTVRENSALESKVVQVLDLTTQLMVDKILKSGDFVDCYDSENNICLAEGKAAGTVRVKLLDNSGWTTLRIPNGDLFLDVVGPILPPPAPVAASTAAATNATTAPPPIPRPILLPGKLVRIKPVSREEAKEEQRTHGGINEKMYELLGATGVIEKVDKDGDVLVKVGRQPFYWSPNLLEAPLDVKVGDKVRIKKVSGSEAEKAQKHHGGINPVMKDLLGSVGVVEDIDKDGDCLVHVSGAPRSFLWSPSLLEALDAPSKPGGGVQTTTASRAPQDLIADANACRNIVKRLVEVGVPLDALDADGNTPLALAALIGSVELTRALLFLGASAHIPNKEGRVPFLVACFGGHAAVAKELISTADIHEPSDLMMQIVCLGFGSVVEVLMDAGLDFPITFPKTPESLYYKRSPFAVASSFLKLSDPKVASIVSRSLRDATNNNPFQYRMPLQSEKLYEFPTLRLNVVIPSFDEQPNIACKVYFEVTLISDCSHVQLGIAKKDWHPKECVEGDVSTHGVGDDRDSFAIDGSRNCIWHGERIAIGDGGFAWHAGDIIGVLIDREAKSVSFSHTGRVVTGIAATVDASRICGSPEGFVAACSISCLESVAFNFGQQDWAYPPDENFASVMELADQDNSPSTMEIWHCGTSKQAGGSRQKEGEWLPIEKAHGFYTHEGGYTSLIEALRAEKDTVVEQVLGMNKEVAFTLCGASEKLKEAIFSHANPRSLKVLNEKGKSPGAYHEQLSFLLSRDLHSGNGNEFSLEFCQLWIKAVQNNVYSGIVEKLLKDHRDLVLRLSEVTDEGGRSALNLASYKNKQTFSQLKFLGRYELSSRKEHKSSTCIVILASDTGSEQLPNPFPADGGDDISVITSASHLGGAGAMTNRARHTSGSARNAQKKSTISVPVALKFMRNKDQFERELFARKNVDLDYVMGVIRTHTHEDPDYSEDIKSRGALASYPYCLVLPACERNLAAIIQHDHISNDWDLIRNYTKQILKCLDSIHKYGKIHSDIKPLNIMRDATGKLILIDMDACVADGSKCGLKISSAFCPPEMVLVKALSLDDELQFPSDEEELTSPRDPLDSSTISMQGLKLNSRAYSVIPAEDFNTSDAQGDEDEDEISHINNHESLLVVVNQDGVVNTVLEPVLSSSRDASMGTETNEPAPAVLNVVGSGGSADDGLGGEEGELDGNASPSKKAFEPDEVEEESMIFESNNKQIIVKKCLMTSSGQIDEMRMRQLGYEPLIASRSYDMWGLGCVFYQLCTGETLFKANLQTDMIADAEGLILLSEFGKPGTPGEAYRTKMLNKIKVSLARNFCSQLLSFDPAFRFDASHMLHHPFITGSSTVSRVAGEKADFDVFLSYRWYACDDIVGKLYELLTTRYGLKVWWDKRCLKGGVSWEQGFCDGLVRSRCFVPILCRAAIKSQYENLTEKSDCDNVLLEQRLAMELSLRGLVERQFPVLIGDYDTSTGTYSHYFRGGCHVDVKKESVARVVVEKVETKLEGHLLRQGLGTPMLEKVPIAAVLNGITDNLGHLLEGGQDLDVLLDECAQKISIMVQDLTSHPTADKNTLGAGGISGGGECDVDEILAQLEALLAKQDSQSRLESGQKLKGLAQKFSTSS